MGIFYHTLWNATHVNLVFNHDNVNFKGRDKLTVMEIALFA